MGRLTEVESQENRHNMSREELHAYAGKLEQANAALRTVRAAGCQCGDDEACAFVRERDALRAEVERLNAILDMPHIRKARERGVL
jgi:hypothetical protein